MTWYMSCGLKPTEITVKATDDCRAKMSMRKYLDRSSKYYGEILDVEEIYGKPMITEYDKLHKEMRKSKKSTITNHKRKTLIIRGDK